eukprot:6320269-Prorocentrum_lima.AAC.1
MCRPCDAREVNFPPEASSEKEGANREPHRLSQDVEQSGGLRPIGEKNITSNGAAYGRFMEDDSDMPIRRD